MILICLHWIVFMVCLSYVCWPLTFNFLYMSHLYSNTKHPTLNTHVDNILYVVVFYISFSIFNMLCKLHFIDHTNISQILFKPHKHPDTEKTSWLFSVWLIWQSLNDDRDKHFEKMCFKSTTKTRPPKCAPSMIIQICRKLHTNHIDRKQPFF